MNLDQIDTILYLNNSINEDDRSYTRKSADNIDHYGAGSSDYIDPTLYNSYAFGNSLRVQLNNMGDGLSAEVTDFKRWVVVNVSYHNTLTGRTASKIFLIVFQDGGDGFVFSTHNKWRSISGVSQASSYIRSASSVLKNSTNNKI